MASQLAVAEGADLTAVVPAGGASHGAAVEAAATATTVSAGTRYPHQVQQKLRNRTTTTTLSVTARRETGCCPYPHTSMPGSRCSSARRSWWRPPVPRPPCCRHPPPTHRCPLLPPPSCIPTCCSRPSTPTTTSRPWR